jgi:hypothetical protein
MLLVSNWALTKINYLQMTCNVPIFKIVGVEGMKNVALFVMVLNLIQQCKMQLY